MVHIQAIRVLRVFAEIFAFCTYFTVSSEADVWYENSPLYNYRLVKKGVTWLEAKRECAAIGGTLPIPRMLFEYENLKSYLNAKQAGISSFAVGIRKSAYGHFELLDNHDTIQCLDLEAGHENKHLVALYGGGYRTIDENEKTNAVCQEYKPDVEVKTLPCSQLNVITAQNCGGPSCEVAVTTNATMGVGNGFVLPFPIPGITTPIANMKFIEENIIKTTFSLGEIQNQIQDPKVDIDIVGYTLKTRNRSFKTKDLYLVRSGTGTKLEWFDFKPIDITYSVLACDQGCCKKLPAITTAFRCKPLEIPNFAPSVMMDRAETTAKDICYIDLSEDDLL